MEFHLSKEKIIEILAPSIGGAFLLSYGLSIYLRDDFLPQYVIVLFSVASCSVLLVNVFLKKKNKYELLALALMSSAFTAAYLTKDNGIIPMKTAALGAAFLFFNYIIKDKSFSSLILVLSSVSLSLFFEGYFYLIVNRVILIAAAILFLIPKILKYEKADNYGKFVFFTIILPIIGIFLTENIGYLQNVYGVITISTIIGVGYFETAFKFEKTV